MTESQLKTRIKRRIRADLSTPVVNDLHDNTIVGWANEFTGDVVHALKDSVYFPTLVKTDHSLTFSSGSAALPSDFEYPVSLKVDADYQNNAGTPINVPERSVRLLDDQKQFDTYDSVNFIVTPTEKRPVGLITDKIYVKPSSITSGKLTYIKAHPAIDSSNPTLFNDIGDRLLTLFVLREYYMFIEDDGLAALAIVENEIKDLKASV